MFMELIYVSNEIKDLLNSMRMNKIIKITCG